MNKLFKLRISFSSRIYEERGIKSQMMTNKAGNLIFGPRQNISYIFVVGGIFAAAPSFIHSLQLTFVAHVYSVFRI